MASSCTVPFDIVLGNVCVIGSFAMTAAASVALGLVTFAVPAFFRLVDSGQISRSIQQRHPKLFGLISNFRNTIFVLLFLVILIVCIVAWQINSASQWSNNAAYAHDGRIEKIKDQTAKSQTKTDTSRTPTGSNPPDF